MPQNVIFNSKSSGVNLSKQLGVRSIFWIKTFTLQRILCLSRCSHMAFLTAGAHGSGRSGLQRVNNAHVRQRPLLTRGTIKALLSARNVTVLLRLIKQGFGESTTRTQVLRKVLRRGPESEREECSEALTVWLSSGLGPFRWGKDRFQITNEFTWFWGHSGGSPFVLVLITVDIHLCL